MCSRRKACSFVPSLQLKFPSSVCALVFFLRRVSLRAPEVSLVACPSCNVTSQMCESTKIKLTFSTIAIYLLPLASAISHRKISTLQNHNVLSLASAISHRKISTLQNHNLLSLASAISHRKISTLQNHNLLSLASAISHRKISTLQNHNLLSLASAISHRKISTLQNHNLLSLASAISHRKISTLQNHNLLPLASAISHRKKNTYGILMSPLVVSFFIKIKTSYPAWLTKVTL